MYAGRDTRSAVRLGGGRKTRNRFYFLPLVFFFPKQRKKTPKYFYNMSIL